MLVSVFPFVVKICFAPMEGAIVGAMAPMTPPSMLRLTIGRHELRISRITFK